MQLFYSDSLHPSSSSYTLSKDESKHVVRVLRKIEGDAIRLTDGRGNLYEAQIDIANPNKCLLQIDTVTYHSAMPYRLHIAVAPTKLNDRYEWFLEKATEIGITEITPILCDNSERTVIKADRFQRILQSAMKQSLQYHVPKLNELIPVKDFILQQSHSKNVFIAHCEEEKKKSLRDIITPKQDYTILIGPEGDFTSKEISLAIDSGFQPITLGNNRLRTETAAVVACHSVSFLN